MAESKANKKALLQYLQDEFNRYDKDYRIRAQAYTKWHMQARGVIDSKAAKSKKSRLFLNKTKDAIINGVGATLDILFPGPDFYDVVGRTEADQKGAETIKKLMDWLLRLGQFQDEAVRYVSQAAVYGTTFGKIRLEQHAETVITKENPLDELGFETGLVTREVQKIVRYPVFETVDVYDMWTDPEGLSPEAGKSRGLFHRVRRTLEYLRARAEGGMYRDVDQMEKEIAGAAKRDDKDRRRQNVGLPILQPRDNEIDLFEYQGLIPGDLAKSAGIEVKEGEFEVECIVTLANMEYIIRAERNEQPGQERMIVSDVWELPIDKSMYGVGIPETVRGPQIALNATVNTRLDNKAWAIAAPLVVNIDKIEDPADLTARVNWVIRTHGSPSDVAQFTQMPNITQESWMEISQFEREIAQGAHQTPESQGDFGSNRTARGVSVAFSAATRPNRLIARGFESNLMGKGMKKMFKVFMQNLDEQLIIRITDDPQAPQFLKVDPISLALDIDFMPSGSTALAMRETTLDGLLRFIDGLSKVIGQIPPEDGRPNWKWLAEQFYKGLGLKNFEKAWVTPQPGMPLPMGGPNAPQGTGPAPSGPAAPAGAGGLGILELFRSMAQGAGGPAT